ncbi:hypothetical protein DENSPDRAFT_78016 [Dentipellis sp. KUC8613]|nr:hypothetical protein DENSPDRAFT_78016 [Dentipellis sp. KUC8613]
MNHQDQNSIPQHWQDMPFEPISHGFPSESIAGIIMGQNQNPFSLGGGLEARGAYTFANPNNYSSFQLNEPLSLINRPPEDIYLGAPQAPPIATSRGPDMYALRRGLYDCGQEYEDEPDTSYAPPHLHHGPILPPPQAQWSPQLLLHGSAPSSSAPRACWASSGGAFPAPPVPMPSVSASSAGLPDGHFMFPSSFDAPHTGVDYDAPPPMPMPPPLTTQFAAQPPAQAYPMLGYGGLGTGCDSFDMNEAHIDFQPGQQMGPGWTDTTLKDISK